MRIELLFEDQSLRVINKPSGIHSVSKSPSIQALLQEQFAEDPFVCDPNFEAGIVHRLDFETSGVLLAAKNIATWEELREHFKQNKINKTYLALVEGKAPDKGSLVSWIGGRYRGSKRVTVYDSEVARSQIAKLNFKLVKYEASQDASAISIELITGVRHQIRAQLSKLGHPLIGDNLYGSKRVLETPPFFLHCKTLLSFHAPIPLEFQRFFQ